MTEQRPDPVPLTMAAQRWMHCSACNDITTHVLAYKCTQCSDEISIRSLRDFNSFVSSGTRSNEDIYGWFVNQLPPDNRVAYGKTKILKGEVPSCSGCPADDGTIECDHDTLECHANLWRYYSKLVNLH